VYPAGKIFYGTILAVIIVPFSIKQLKDFHQLSCKIQAEVVSKPSIGFKVKADWGGQPQEYWKYFEDWTSQSNPEIESEGRF
jgi:hypothetical protein